MSETNRVIPTVMLVASRLGAVLFRQNVAQGVVGHVHWVRSQQAITVRPGDAVVRHARVLHAGLCKGSSDMIGWHSVVVTPEMVGRRVAVFCAVEAKDGSGRVDVDQQNFIDQVRLAGGRAGIARNGDDAVAILKTQNEA